jgi:hypothetical protein
MDKDLNEQVTNPDQIKPLIPDETEPPIPGQTEPLF